MLVSDSQSGLMSARSAYGDRRGELLWRIVDAGKQICRGGKELVLDWVPGHCGLIGNELADVAVKRARDGDQVGCASLFKSAQCL